jgi:protein SDA1
VNVISQACFSKFSKVKVDAIQFFLSAESTEIEEEDVRTSPARTNRMYACIRHLLTRNVAIWRWTTRMQYVPTVQDMVKKYSTHANKTKKRARLLQKGIKKAQKLQHKEKDIKVNFPAIELLNDPQGFAEKLLADLKHSTERFEVTRTLGTPP